MKLIELFKNKIIILILKENNDKLISKIFDMILYIYKQKLLNFDDFIKLGHILIFSKLKKKHIIKEFLIKNFI